MPDSSLRLIKSYASGCRQGVLIKAVASMRRGGWRMRRNALLSKYHVLLLADGKFALENSRQLMLRSEQLVALVEIYAVIKTEGSKCDELAVATEGGEQLFFTSLQLLRPDGSLLSRSLAISFTPCPPLIWDSKNAQRFMFRNSDCNSRFPSIPQIPSRNIQAYL